MITGLNPKQVVDVVYSKDVGDKPTKWGIGVLLLDHKNALLSGAIGEKGQIKYDVLLSRVGDILKNGLKTVKNYKKDAESPASDYDVVDDALIQTIPYEVQIELMDKIIEFNFISKEEAKN